MMEAVRSAKRSLAESFTGMIRRRASTDTVLAGEGIIVIIIVIMTVMMIMIIQEILRQG